MKHDVGTVWLRKENEYARSEEPDWCHMLLLIDEGVYAFLHESGRVKVMRQTQHCTVAWHCWELAP